MKVFIVSNLYNNEYILPTYTSSLNNFIHTLGTENVFVSIYESYSTDCTKSMLAQLDRDLHQINVSRRILLDDRATRKGKLSAVSDRVDFLANVRNTAMQPLVKASVQFTHVLWINGIVFTTQDALNLLRTNNGHYDQACAMDFIGNGFYDTWLTRDTHGDTLKRQWPYLKSGKDVDAMRHGKPFEVNSCWNGISAFDAKWFYPSNNGSAPRSSALESVDEDGLLQLALKFRASEASMPVFGMSVDIVRHPSGDLSFTPYDLDQPGGQSGLQHRQYWLVNWPIPSPILGAWRIIWRDFMAYRLFVWITEGQRWPNECKLKQRYRAAPPEPTSSTAPTAVAATSLAIS